MVNKLRRLLCCCRKLNICFWHEQPGLRLFPLPKAWLTMCHYVTRYLASLLYHASLLFSNHPFGNDVNLAPIETNLVTAYHLHVYYFDSDSGEARCRRNTKLKKKKKKWIQNYYGFIGYGVLLAHKWVLSSLLSFSHRAAEEFMVFRSWSLRNQIGATSRSRRRRWMTDWWWPIFNALLNV